MSLMSEIRNANSLMPGTDRQKESFCIFCNVCLSDLLFSEYIGTLYKLYLYSDEKGVDFCRSSDSNVITVSYGSKCIYNKPGFITAIQIAYDYASLI